MRQNQDEASFARELDPQTAKLDPQCLRLMDRRQREVAIDLAREPQWFGLAPEAEGRPAGTVVRVLVELAEEVPANASRRRSAYEPRQEPSKDEDDRDEERSEALTDILQRGCRWDTVAGRIVTAEVDIEQLGRIAESPHVVHIEVSRQLQITLDQSRHEVGADTVQTGNPSFTGKGVLIGIIDTGIDFTHPNFIDANGKSRVIALWDQKLTRASVLEKTPRDYTYGVEYEQADIDAALKLADPFSQVRHKDDEDGHGTLVAGIAAGNGKQPRAGHPADAYVGIAPDAGLIVVRNVWKRHAFANALGDSKQLLDAIDYIVTKAAALGLPVVINLSMGDNLGAHDGTSKLETSIDTYLGGAGVAIVVAAGNATGHRQHARGTVSQTQDTAVRFFVPGDEVPDVLEVWYLGSDQFSATIVTPSKEASPTLTPNQHREINLANGNHISAVSSTNAKPNGDNTMSFTISRGTANALEKGLWKLILHGDSVAGSGQFDVWIQRDTVHDQVSRFWEPSVDDSVTVMIPGTSGSIITVASYAFKGVVRAVGEHSGRGPTRVSAVKPDISAPGHNIITTRSRFDPYKKNAGKWYFKASGTSMAAPHVTGTIALMFEKNKTLRQADIRGFLSRSARPSPGVGKGDPAWGDGMLDASGAIALVP